MDIETEVNNIKDRISRLEASMLAMTASLNKIEGSTSTTEMLIKWVILPFVVSLGGLVGIKIALPSA